MPTTSFPRELRLLTPAQFRLVFAKPIRVSSAHFTLLAIPNQLEHPRLGLAIPKKMLKRAVWRNRVKRLIRENFRHHQQALPQMDIVIIAKGGLSELPNDAINLILEKLWRNLSRRYNG